MALLKARDCTGRETLLRLTSSLNLHSVEVDHTLRSDFDRENAYRPTGQSWCPSQQGGAGQAALPAQARSPHLLCPVADAMGHVVYVLPRLYGRPVLLPVAMAGCVQAPSHQAVLRFCERLLAVHGGGRFAVLTKIWCFEQANYCYSLPTFTHTHTPCAALPLVVATQVVLGKQSSLEYLLRRECSLLSVEPNLIMFTMSRTPVELRKIQICRNPFARYQLLVAP